MHARSLGLLTSVEEPPEGRSESEEMQREGDGHNAGRADGEEKLCTGQHTQHLTDLRLNRL